MDNSWTGRCQNISSWKRIDLPNLQLKDWAIVDGPGYPDFQELPNGQLALVESNKLTVRYHEIDPMLVDGMKRQVLEQTKGGEQTPKSALEGMAPAVSWEQSHKARGSMALRAPVLPDLRSGSGFSIFLSFFEQTPSPPTQTNKLETK